MNKFIEILFNNYMQNDVIGIDKEYARLRTIFSDSFDEATKNLNKETTKEIEESLDKFSTMHFRHDEIVFEYAFKLGANFMITILDDSTNKKRNNE